MRTAAACSFTRAGARLEDAKAAWEQAQEEVAEVRTKAVADLLSTGMAVEEVAGLLRVPERELRALRAAAARRDEKADGAEALERVTGSGGAGEPPEVRLASQAAAGAGRDASAVLLGWNEVARRWSVLAWLAKRHRFKQAGRAARC